MPKDALDVEIGQIKASLEQLDLAEVTEKLNATHSSVITAAVLTVDNVLKDSVVTNAFPAKRSCMLVGILYIYRTNR